MTDARALPPEIIRAMRPADRKRAGVLTADELATKAELRNERALQTLCEQELSRRGIPFLHLSNRARECPGWPDLVWPGHEGRFCAVELKTKDGKLSQDQIDTLGRLEVCGARVGVVRTYDGFRQFVQGMPPSVNHRKWEGYDPECAGVRG